LCKKFEATFPLTDRDCYNAFRGTTLVAPLPSSKVKLVEYRDGKVKKLHRVIQKFFYKYELDATRIVDILRCSFVFEDVFALYQGLYSAIKFFEKEHNGARVEDTMWMKDRFIEPLPSEYRDVLLQVKMPGCDSAQPVWVELQFHLRKALKCKSKVLHKVYKTMRHLPNDREITKAVRALLPENRWNPYLNQCKGYFRRALDGVKGLVGYG